MGLNFGMISISSILLTGSNFVYRLLNLYQSLWILSFLLDGPIVFGSEEKVSFSIESFPTITQLTRSNVEWEKIFYKN